MSICMRSTNICSASQSTAGIHLKSLQALLQSAGLPLSKDLSRGRRRGGFEKVLNCFESCFLGGFIAFNNCTSTRMNAYTFCATVESQQISIDIPSRMPAATETQWKLQGLASHDDAVIVARGLVRCSAGGSTTISRLGGPAKGNANLMQRSGIVARTTGAQKLMHA